MGELADAWSAAGRPEHLRRGARRSSRCRARRGAAGAVHGALQAGALATTFTALAGPAADDPEHVQDRRRAARPRVFHVAARAARHPRAVDLRRPQRRDGRAADRLGACSPRRSVQEAQDFAAHRPGGHARERASRSSTSSTASGPRTRSTRSSSSTGRRPAGDDRRGAGRAPTAQRALSPDRPILRGTAQNPDVFFQAREAVNPFYRGGAGRSSQETMDRFAAPHRPAVPACSTTSARPDAERVVVHDGLGGGAAERGGRGASECARARRSAWSRSGSTARSPPRPSSPRCRHDRGDRRPRPDQGAGRARRAALPGRRHRPASRQRAAARRHPAGHRRALRPVAPRSSRRRWPPRSSTSSAGREPKRHFTVGIVDDVTHLSLDVRPRLHDRAGRRRPRRLLRARQRRHGRREQELGQDHRREHRPLRPGLLRLRLEEVGLGRPSRTCGSARGRSDSSYLIERRRLRRLPPVRLPRADRRARVRRAGRDLPAQQPLRRRTRSGSDLPRAVQEQIIDKELRFYVVDAERVAREAGLGGRINTVMQTCFFALSGVLPRDEAIAEIKRRDQEDLRQARRGRRSSRTSPPSTARSRALHEVDGPGASPTARDAGAADLRRRARLRQAGHAR